MSERTMFIAFKVVTIVVVGVMWARVMKYGKFEGKELLGRVFVTLAWLGMAALPFLLERRFKRERKEEENGR